MEATIEDFSKLDIRIATIKSVDDHPKADKLFILKLDLGDEERQIVAGIRSYYKKEELVGKQIVFIYNLKPALLRGVESQGMMLTADDRKTVAFLTPEKKVETNAKVR